MTEATVAETAWCRIYRRCSSSKGKAGSFFTDRAIKIAVVTVKVNMSNYMSQSVCLRTRPFSPLYIAVSCKVARLNSGSTGQSGRVTSNVTKMTQSTSITTMRCRNWKGISWLRLVLSYYMYRVCVCLFVHVCAVYDTRYTATRPWGPELLPLLWQQQQNYQ